LFVINKPNFYIMSTTNSEEVIDNVGSEVELGNGAVDSSAVVDSGVTEGSGSNAAPMPFEEDPDYADFYNISGAAKDSETVQISKSEYDSLLADANSLRTIKGNPAAYAAVQHFAGGGSLEDLVSSVDTTDYSKKSPEELWRLSHRIEFPDITEEEMEDVASEWENMTPIARRKAAKDIAERLNSSRESGKQGWAKKIQDAQQSSMSAVQKFTQDFQQEINRWKEKGNYWGMPYDEVVANKVSQFVTDRNGMIFLNPDGSLNARLFHQAVVAINYFPTIASAKKMEGAMKAASAVMKEVSNTGGGAAPVKPGNPEARTNTGNAYEKYRQKQAEEARRKSASGSK
jgi:hypothetical protein